MLGGCYPANKDLGLKDCEKLHCLHFLVMEFFGVSLVSSLMTSFLGCYVDYC